MFPQVYIDSSIVIISGTKLFRVIRISNSLIYADVILLHKYIHWLWLLYPNYQYCLGLIPHQIPQKKEKKHSKNELL